MAMLVMLFFMFGIIALVVVSVIAGCRTGFKVRRILDAADPKNATRSDS